MKRNKAKVVVSLVTIISVVLIGTNAYAHSGRTDSSGGHKDKNNVSGLGYYHYHCGGNPAHLHTNGVCPYSSNQSTTQSQSSSTSNYNKTETTTDIQETSSTPTTIEATEIKINEEIESMEIGEKKKLTATIMPEDATDKSVVWKSSNEEIATVTEDGEIIAQKAGTVEITATTQNGKMNTVKVTIKEEEKIDISNTIPVSSTLVNDSNNSTGDENSEDSSAGGIITLGLLGGGGYWIYKKSKNAKSNK